nr:hypothetical protein [Tanacetum cinerariifolium]
MEPEDFLVIGDEDLSTIPETESDEVIKSSVNHLVPIPSESEDTSGSDSEYDLSSCDDFSPIDDCSNFEDSRARGFVHRPLEFQSLAYGNPIS